MFYADRNVRPCMILGYTLTTFPKSLMHNQSNRNLWHNCKRNNKTQKKQLDQIVSRSTLHNSEDPTIVMGKPVTTTFVSDDVHSPTEKVGCLQVTSQLQEFLNHFPPESKEKAFEQIYQILQVLDAYLIDKPQQHLYCISPDSEYISLIMYTTKLEIDLCNFPAIWAVLSILLDTQSNELHHVKNLQQVVIDYYDQCPTEVMSR